MTIYHHPALFNAVIISSEVLPCRHGNKTIFLSPNQLEKDSILEPKTPTGRACNLTGLCSLLNGGESISLG